MGILRDLWLTFFAYYVICLFNEHDDESCKWWIHHVTVRWLINRIENEMNIEHDEIYHVYWFGRWEKNIDFTHIYYIQ